VIVVFACCRRWRNNLNEPLDPFPFWVAAEQKGGQEVNISLAFLHWIGIALHPRPFVSDIAIFVLKGDVKLQLTNLTVEKCINQSEFGLVTSRSITA